MNLVKSVLFRVDFNSYIGLGHIQRCINLATILYNDGWKIFFVLKNFSKKKKIKNNNFNFI